MRKQLGTLTSLLFLWAMAFFVTGCSQNRCCDDTGPVCEQPCAPVCPQPMKHHMPCEPVCAEPCMPQPCPPAPCMPKPACPTNSCMPQPACANNSCAPTQPECAPPCMPPACQEPMCKPLIKCKHPNSNELRCLDGITVSARNPSMCMLGDQYPFEFDIKACDDVCDVIVTTHLPEGVSFIRSEPEAKVEGRKLIWHIDSMSKGDCVPARVWLKCECEGELCACFCASAVPVRFCSLLCAKPVLTCEKCGPEEVCPGDPIHYTITVSNRGSCAAEDVVVTDNIPDGTEHRSCLKTLTFKLGRLEPCETKRVNICLTAVKRGKICNTAVVTACNADSVSCQWCTNICKECVEISKIGPKEQAIGKNADYQITVINPGDKPLTNVVVTDCAPSSTSIVAANGATVSGNQAVWRLKEMKPGEKRTFNITLTTCLPGCFTNRVNVTNCQGCCASAEFMTRWKGRPALNVQICDTEDPICVGEPTSYCITVVNQGSEADTNVSVVVRFPNEIMPISATGDTPGTVSGQTVTFAPYNNFGPRQVLKYRVDAKAKASGDARVNVEVSSDSIKTPITQQESTIVN